MATVSLRRKAWMDVTEDFPVPDSWNITMLNPRDAKAIGDRDIEASFAKPVESDPLSKLAQGKSSALIIVDDLSRPTPADKVIPFLLQELQKAGIPDESIHFLVGGGAHRPLDEGEIAMKIGKGIAASFRVYNHDAHSGHLEGIGKLKNGAPVYVNPLVLEAEVVVTISGIYPHPSVGMSGGAKSILPGIAGMLTINYCHGNTVSRNRGRMEKHTEEMDFRNCAEEIANMVGLDFSVNVVINSNREIAGVFPGGFKSAHQMAVEYAQGVFQTDVPKRLAETANIVLSNAYPIDYDPVQAIKAEWAAEIFENAYHVGINSATDGVMYHGMSSRLEYGEYLRRKAVETKVAVPDNLVISSRDQQIMLSEHFDENDFYRSRGGGVLFRSWEGALEALEAVCPKASVAVLPCAPIQIPTIV